MATAADVRERRPDGSMPVIGTRPIRHDGLDKVTGRARYGADVHMAGMLHGKILRSPHAHARIRSIDTSKAEAHPEVRAVATAEDFPILEEQALDFVNAQGNARMIAENDLAHTKVLYKGHAVAAVAATNPHVAEEALKLIEVEYDGLPAVLTVVDAMKDDAPVLHEDLTTTFRVERAGRGEDTGARGNVAGHIQLKRGDLNRGFEEADLIVEREFTTQMVHQGYIEPFACAALWAADGHITIWTCTQGIFGIRAATAAITGVSESMIKVVPMEVGGGFGGKGIGYLEPVAAVLSRKAGRPVKIEMTRKEVFEGTGPTSGSLMRCKIGVTDEGRITAAQLYLAYEAGGFPGSPVAGGALSGLGPYKIDNLLVDGFDVVCNKLSTQAYRAPGQPPAAFAVETVIDELAEKLDVDPIELRLRNAVKEGDRAPSGVPHARFGCVEVEEAMRSHPHYSAPLEGANRGRGVAVGYRLNGGGTGSSATINVNSNGTVNLITGSVDLSGSRVSIAMQVAETLGIRADDVSPSVVDTDSVGWTGGSGGSRAAIAAAEDVIRHMGVRASVLWEVQPDEVELGGGVFICAKDPADRFTFKELASRLMETGGARDLLGVGQTRGCGRPARRQHRRRRG